jgi:hypothetical protein
MVVTDVAVEVVHAVVVGVVVVLDGASDVVPDVDTGRDTVHNCPPMILIPVGLTKWSSVAYIRRFRLISFVLSFAIISTALRWSLQIPMVFSCLILAWIFALMFLHVPLRPDLPWTPYPFEDFVKTVAGLAE